VLAVLLGGGGEAQQLAFVALGVVAVDAGDGGPAGGERAGLVEDDVGQAVGAFECGGVFDEDAAFGTDARADEDRRGHREPQRARACDDEHRDARGQPARPVAGKHAPAQQRAERDESQLLRLAAAAEQDSEHPLAKAIVDYAKSQGIDVPPATKFKSATAAGVTASVGGEVVKVGRLSALREQGVEVPGGFDADREARLPGARTIVAVAIDNTAVGLIGLADQVRPEASEALAALNKLGLRTVMMTGDSQFAADHVARQLKIDRTFAEVKPADKRQKVLDLQVGNKSVVMVGDGINDAPALAEADLGIAIGGGTDIARDAGHVVLVGSDLRQLATTIKLGRATMRRIIAGLLWASVYNISLIPLAATGLLPPMFAALAMSLSSVSVVINALWLRWTWRG